VVVVCLRRSLPAFTLVEFPVACVGQIRFPEMERAFKKFLNMDDEKEGNVTFDKFIELFGAEPTGETKKVRVGGGGQEFGVNL
jgi:hypothetical protein